jgi:hypothetical protein
MLLAVLAGCSRLNSLDDLAEAVQGKARGTDPAPILRVASPWPHQVREQVERAFRGWLERAASDGERARVRLDWIEVPSGFGLDRSLSAAPPPDVLLGGPLAGYERWAGAGALEKLSEDPGGRMWIVARRNVLRPMESSADEPNGEAGHTEAHRPLNDPRNDPATLAVYQDRLREGGWRDGYAAILRYAASASTPAGWRPSARAIEESREGIIYLEGAAIRRGARSEYATRFLRFLREWQDDQRIEAEPAFDSETSSLIADLLGATTVDAHEELRGAWAVLSRQATSQGTIARVWLKEPPPWPPASIDKLQRRGGEKGMTLIQDLAGQIAPDAELRVWLVESWLRPSRPIDVELLEELAHACGGRLVREPRFRQWLRGEWTAWARQRYRRVARLASARAVAENEQRPSSSTQQGDTRR